MVTTRELAEEILSDLFRSRFEIQEELGSSERTQVLRAIEVDSGRQVAVKILVRAGRGPRFESYLEFQRLVKRLEAVSHPRIARLIAVDRTPSAVVLIREFVPGALLSEMKPYLPLSPRVVIPLLHQLIDALQPFHQACLYHRCLTPRNIVLSGVPSGRPPSETWDVDARIIDFGHSVLDEPSLTGDEPAEDFAFIAPERVGILPQLADGRADLYSLGVIAYHLLSGRLPFEGASAGAYLHRVMATQPFSLRVPGGGVHPDLSKLILSLIARSPNDRPVSLAALGGELARLKDTEDSSGEQLSWKTAGGISLRAPEFVEREGQLKRLQNSFDQAVAGKGGVVLIGGAEGNGASRLAEELRPHVEAAQGLFLSTQGNEIDRNLPFHAVKEVIDGFMAAVNKLPRDKRQQITARVRSAVGGLGQGLIRLAPSVGKILETAPEMVALDPERERARFITTVINFLVSLGAGGQPIVIFFDDLHWIDTGSREIFHRLSSRLGRSSILLLGAGRDDLVNWNEFPQTAERVRVEPLSFDATARLLRRVTQLDSEDLEGIPEFAFERARGNVRFTIEIARLLMQELDERTTGVRFDISRLEQLVPARHAREIVLHRVERLQPDVREVLGTAAVFGRRFQLPRLLQIAGGDEAVARRAIQQGLAAQVITPYAKDDEDVLLFVDVAVREDLYQRLDPFRRQELHSRLADTLEESGADDGRIFETAYHRLRGGDARKAVAAAVRAGDAASRSYANLQAAQLYEEALKAAVHGGISIESGEERRILESLGDALALQGRYPEAEVAYRRALALGDGRLCSARLYGKVGETFFRRGENREALANLESGLASLGTKLPQGMGGAIVSIVCQALIFLLRLALPRKWRQLKGDEERAVAREAVKIYHAMAYAYYFIDIARCLDIHLRQLNLAERVGPSRELAQTYSDHGIVCSIIPLHKRAHRYQEAGLAMRRAIGDEWGVGQSHGFLGVCCYYRGEWQKALQHFDESIRILDRMGDQWEVEAAYCHSAFTHRLMGNFPAALETLDTLLSLSEEINDRKFQAFALFARSIVFSQRGDLDLAVESADRAIALEPDNLTRALALRAKALALLRYRDPAQALEAIEEAAVVIRLNHIRNEYVVENQSALAEVLIAGGERILASGKRERLSQLRRIAPAVRAAVRSARLFPNSLGYALRVRGVFHWLSGSIHRALADFEASRRVLVQQGARYELGRTQLEAGRWLTRIGDPRGGPYLEEAARLFEEVGARRDLEEARDLRERGWVGPRSGGADVRRNPRGDNRQLASLFKVSQTIASILEIDRLLRRAVDLAIEVLGAERGFILLAEEGNPDPVVRVARDVGQREIPSAEYALNGELLKRVFTEGVPLAVTEEIAPNPGQRPAGVRQRRSVLCVPLKSKEKVIGLISIDNRLVPDLFQGPEIELLSTFAAQLAVAIENARAYSKIEELNIGLEEKVRERTGELLRAKMVLEKASLMKDEFLANMSHELRTPLNAVIALADILSEETFGPLNEKQMKYVGDIVQSGTHLLSLINDILDLSKIEAGQMQLQLSEIDLNKVLADSIVMVKERAGKRSIAIRLNLENGLPMVKADLRKIKQVIFNLLSNAVKFTEDGGWVGIISRRAAGEVIVTVEDNGIGIAKEDLGRLFQEFQQIDSSLSRKYAGSGLGLALSKKFVELHQGRIWVESEPRKGSRFSFSLPIS